MTTYLLILVLLLVMVQLAVLLTDRRKKSDASPENIRLLLREEMDAFRRSGQEEFARNRQELLQGIGDLRGEIGRTLQENRLEISAALKSFEESHRREAAGQNDVLQRQFSGLLDTQERIRKETAAALDNVRETLQERLEKLQEHNALKLEEMRIVVDEKLQATLEQRLSDSFRQVSERLQMVHEGLGEMRHLATGVGDLKKVLSNVKTRGVLGEMQLQNVLSSLLAPDQYGENVALGETGRERVEFAIRLPGRDENGVPVYLPVDAKFPMEAYYRMVEASERSDSEAVRHASKEIETEMQRCAKEISQKYIHPPKTTDFAIMFLPVEGLFAEVVRNTSLLETLQRQYGVIVTGPTTFAALLNSLQMGFRTLAIEKRTSEVWNVLAGVKQEFGKFGEVLDRAQNRLSQASTELDRLVGVRTRSIEKSLKRIGQSEPERLDPLEDRT
ncbi:MAG TPA: DNA recombination protein RmuC [Prosthecochloris aestuarii]|uniref:DNA recombination protein RmuC n=1 Tax=Prosthecochloris aestuarii TaxID=1102 RepID=A0A831SNP3_PROAE|nr:DNA recombination protein RmuC [Prosthecochloris sp.]HED30966.1 DNA recombination protein RmuC [Prosthecochloris aestuarii]